MNNRQKADAEEQRLNLFRVADWKCVVCGKPLMIQGVGQLAHRVPKKASMLNTWGPEVIHSALNLIPVESLECNAKVSLGCVNVDSRALLTRIVRIQTGREAMPDLGDYYRAVGQEVRDGK